MPTVNPVPIQGTRPAFLDVYTDSKVSFVLEWVETTDGQRACSTIAQAIRDIGGQVQQTCTSELVQFQGRADGFNILVYTEPGSAWVTVGVSRWTDQDREIIPR